MLINDEIQRQVLPVLARATVTPETDVQQRAGSQLQFNPGQQVKAEIVANLPNSLYLARIAGEIFKLEIPLNVPPGATLEMTFVSADPRITFQLYRPEGGESVSLSSMGKWLSSIAADATPLQVAEGALVESPLVGTALLGERLRSAIAQSGLFYEAHLARWAAGGLPLGELLKEPQGKLSRAARREGEPVPGEEGAEFADRRTFPLVREQLNILNAGMFAWKGDAWPGQGMELAVAAPRGEGEEREVEATLSLVLERLGGVETKLRLGKQGLSLEFCCGKEGAAARLLDRMGELRSALASRDIPLARVAAKDDAAAE